MGYVDWLKDSGPPPEMYRLPEEDERLKGNLGAIRKGGGVEWILDRNSTTSITPKKQSALRSKEREELK